MAQPRNVLWVSLVLLTNGAACGNRAPEKKTALPGGDAGLPRIEQVRAWGAHADTLLGRRPAQQTWSDPRGVPDRSHLPEAHYAINRALDLLRACGKEPDAADCMDAFGAGGKKILGSLGAGLMIGRRMADALSTKAEILASMREGRAALKAADESLQHGEHPYSHKLRGDALVLLGKDEEAASSYARAATTDPYITFLRALCLVRLGRMEEARPILDVALAKRPALRGDVEGAGPLLTKAGL
jgi:tetratricopeptide (TPR) repeat protein